MSKFLFQRIFSSSKKKNSDSEKKSSKKDKNNSFEVGLGLAGGSIIANNVLGANVMKNIRKPQSPEDKIVSEKILREAKKNNPGLKVDSRRLRGVLGPAYGLDTNTVYTNGGTSASGLSHELGHAHYHTNKDAGAVGKYSHKLYKALGSNKTSKRARMAGIVSGYMSGANAAKKEAKGEKESKLSRHSSWATPVAMSAPMLVAEAAASYKGKKLLRNAGASKQLRRQATKDLTSAWGTYATGTLANAGIAEAARGIGYSVNRKKKKEKE